MKEEEAILKGEQGETLELTYRILVATGEATNAERLVPIEWSHLSGVNYNTIGDAGEEFLSKISQTACVKVKTTLNSVGFDIEFFKTSDAETNPSRAYFINLCKEMVEQKLNVTLGCNMRADKLDEEMCE